MISAGNLLLALQIPSVGNAWAIFVNGCVSEIAQVRDVLAVGGYSALAKWETGVLKIQHKHPGSSISKESPRRDAPLPAARQPAARGLGPALLRLVIKASGDKRLSPSLLLCLYVGA